MATGPPKNKPPKPEFSGSLLSGMSLTTGQEVAAEDLSFNRFGEELHRKLPKNPLSVSPASSSKHEFSSPWQNSDLVLIIEDQKLHVHRVILQMISPVLCHIFKETDSNEVPLLRTKVSDFVDLLRVIYPQFKNNITLDNIEQIYRLAEEYQIESVVEICREYLTQVKKTTRNAMKILVTAQVCNIHEVRKQCYEVLEHLTVAKLKSDQHFEDLDEKSVRNVLLPKAERLEKCLREIQPQLVGLIDCVLYWCLSAVDKKSSRYGHGATNTCPVHHSSTMANTPMQARIKCSVCKEMILKMVRNSVSVECYGRKETTEPYYSYAGTYFDEKIVDVLQEMFSLLKT